MVIVKMSAVVQKKLNLTTVVMNGACVLINSYEVIVGKHIFLLDFTKRVMVAAMC